MWTGRKLKTDYEYIHEIEVCCDTEKCSYRESELHIDYMDEWVIKSESKEYSRFDMTVVKAVSVTDKNRIHVRIMYLSEEQKTECMTDIYSWIIRYGSNEVIEVANGSGLFKQSNAM